MFGTYQQSQLRIEVDASESTISQCLLRPEQIRRWMLPNRLSPDLPDALTTGMQFTSWLGPVAVVHQVEQASTRCLWLLLSQGIDGYHRWQWGEGWVQSSIEGVSLLPLNLGQTVSLLNLRRVLADIHNA